MNTLLAYACSGRVLGDAWDRDPVAFVVIVVVSIILVAFVANIREG